MRSNYPTAPMVPRRMGSPLRLGAVGLPRNIWPGKGAWLSGPRGRESGRSRRGRREEREAAIRRRRHVRGIVDRVRMRLTGRHGDLG